MRNFTLATFYDPTSHTEMKLFYVDGDAAVRIMHNMSGLLDTYVIGGGSSNIEEFHAVLEKAWLQFSSISRVGTFYDNRGDCFFKEQYSLEHLKAALERALHPSFQPIWGRVGAL